MIEVKPGLSYIFRHIGHSDIVCFRIPFSAPPIVMQTLSLVLTLLVVAFTGFALMRTRSSNPQAERIPAAGAITGNAAPVPAPRNNVDPIAAASPRLICMSGPQKGTSIPITGPGLIVGRSTVADLIVGDACVSTRHAWIGSVNGHAVLRDLNSTNGTFLNAKMNSPVREAQLNPGDTIFFGRHQASQWRFTTE